MRASWKSGYCTDRRTDSMVKALGIVQARIAEETAGLIGFGEREEAVAHHIGL